MPGFRHVLSDNRWEIQCPSCQQFVPATRRVFAGEWTFPEHVRWAPSWTHRIMERWPDAWRRRGLIQLVTRVEALVRAVTWRFEPKCVYREAHEWNKYIPPSGLTAGGPLS